MNKCIKGKAFFLTFTGSSKSSKLSYFWIFIKSDPTHHMKEIN